MADELRSAELDAFRSAVAARLGLYFDDGKLGLLAEVLSRRAEARGIAPPVYLQDLSNPDLWRKEQPLLAKELTVTETYFFRHLEQFRAFHDVALPDRLRAPAAGRPLRLLSAGCASGEEAYSLAILLRQEFPGAPPREASIHAIDINPVMLDRARQARYTTWSLRETPADVRQRWFRERGRDFVLDEKVREMVTFEERNLSEDDPSFWRPQAFDVVFCRNVLMYFTPEGAAAVVARLARALVPGGFLFLGHAETLRGISQDFHLRHSHGTFYYEKRDGSETRAVPRSLTFPLAGPDAPESAAATALLEGAESWVETIRRASERIQTLTGPGAPRPAERPRPGRKTPVIASRPELGRAVELFRSERFGEALAQVGALPPESASDPEVLLLRAALLAHSGDLAAAERVCTELLARDEMSAGAHYLLAICREGLGDRQGALDHDQVAAYLDPGFAMPRLHLGLLARRLGKREAARRELGQALVLLRREDASRVLLFGGGFSREALVALCRAELLASGGTP